MRRLLDIVAQSLSIGLYPLFVPTYGIALFCYAYASRVVSMPALWVIVAIVGTFLLTCLLPATAIWLLIRQGRVSSMQIYNAQERKMPYLYATIGFGFWSYLLIAILHVPIYIGLVAIGATVAIGIVSLINRRWKISAHLTGFGGLIGGLMSYCLGVGLFPAWPMLLLWLGITWLLMGARLYLNAHTPAQVAAGWLLGLSCTFIPYALLTYVQ